MVAVSKINADVSDVALPAISHVPSKAPSVTRSVTFVDIKRERSRLTDLPNLTSRSRETRMSWHTKTDVSLSKQGPTERAGLKDAWLKARDIRNPFNYTDSELIEVIENKISTGLRGLQQYFYEKGHKGLLHRDLLHEVLVNICGYISHQLFDRLLNRLGLSHEQYISFDMFISKFSDNPVVQQQYVIPNKIKRQREKEPKDLERHMKFVRAISRSHLAPASYSIVVLRELAKAKQFKPDLHLPPSVVSGREGLLKLHLRRMIMGLTGYEITDSELDKLWTKFDPTGGGTVSRDEFYRIIGYKAPIVKSAPIPRSDGEQLTKNIMTSNVREDNDNSMAADNSKTAANQLALPPPIKQIATPSGFVSLIEEMVYHFELSITNLQAALQYFDAAKDNFVPKTSFRTVLRQFGFRIGALDFEKFLVMNHILVLNDLIEYKEFINRFTLREAHGVVSRIVNDDSHTYNMEPNLRMRHTGTGAEGLSPEELEAALVELLMGKYLQFLSDVRKLDTKATGFVSQTVLRPLIEKLVGRQLNISEWEKMLNQVGYNQQGDVYYENLIAVINKRRPVWNIKDLLGHKAKVVPKPLDTVELETLRSTAKQEKQEMQSQMTPFDFARSLNDISSSIRDLMKTRFTSLDYAYRLQDRKMTGRLDKNMLQAILRQCDLELSGTEIDKLWSTLALARDGLYTWSKFCQRYVGDEAKLKKASNAKFEEDDLSSAVELNKNRLRNTQSRASRTVTSHSQKISDPVLTKLHPQVIQNLDAIEKRFESCDPKGRGHVSRLDAEDTFVQLKFDISAEELSHILQLFDLENCGWFNYKYFMYAMKPRPVYSRMSEKSSHPKPSSRLLKSRFLHQLKGRVPELRRQFRKLDPLKQGHLSFMEFRNCLQYLGVRMPEDESFSEIASLLDHDLKGKINYEEFTSLCNAI